MTFIICASGPSLTQKDVNYVRGKGTVIAVNNTVFLAPWADILYSCDFQWWQAYEKEVKEFKNRKISITYGENGVEKWPYCSRGRGFGKEIIHTGGNSGYQAINVAILLGAKKIILLGFDMQKTNGKSHHHGDHVRGLNTSTKYDCFISHFNYAAKEIQNSNINIINCTKQTALKCFKKQDLKKTC